MSHGMNWIKKRNPMKTNLSRYSTVLISAFIATMIFGALLSADVSGAAATTSEAPVDVYRARRSNIDVRNPDELLKLANWAMKQERFRRN